MNLFKPVLPVLVHIAEAFPPLVDDICQLLLQLGRMCISQASLCSHFDTHLGKTNEIFTQESKQLAETAKYTFNQIIVKAILKRNIYK